MSFHFETVTIVGVGLLGGSLGLALKERGMANRIRGVGHRQVSLDKALAHGTIDEASMDAVEASRGADLVVICTPAALVNPTLDLIQPVCSETCVVTDVASTKAEICTHAHNRWPSPRRFVGSHPMAGSEKFGPEYSSGDLYEGRSVIVEPEDGHASDAYEAIIGLWRGVGSKVVVESPDVHDALVARTSHIPHITAAALANLAVQAGAREIRPFAATGFRDVTRVAAGRPEIWRDICLTNESAIAKGLDCLAEELQQVSRMVSEGDSEALNAYFAKGNEARERIVGE